jgi:ribonuclease Z
VIRTIVLGSGGAMPSPKTNPSSLAVKFGEVYLFDCCEGAQKEMMKHGVSHAKVRCIFLSHLHADHFLGVLGLVQTGNLLGRTLPLLLAGPKGTKALFETILGLKHLQAAFPIEYKEAREGEVFRNELFSVRAFPVTHSTPAVGYALETHAYRRFDEAKAKRAGVKGRYFSELQQKGEADIKGRKVKYADVTYEQKGKRLVWSGDTTYCARLVKEAKGADLLAHDACFLEEHRALADEKKHSTAADAARAAKEAGVKRLLLTHFSNRYEDRAPLLAEARRVFPESVLAEEGLELLV